MCTERVVEDRRLAGKKARDASTMTGSISMVTSDSSAGLASKECDDMPVPWPMTATCLAAGPVDQRHEGKEYLGRIVSCEGLERVAWLTP